MVTAKKGAGRSRRYAMTINFKKHDEDKANQKDLDTFVEMLKGYLEKSSKLFRYLIAGREVGASGTLHLQCYVELLEAKTWDYVKNLDPFKSAHIEIANASAEKNIEYCSKDDVVVLKFGEPAGGPKKGGQVHGKLEQDKFITWRELIQDQVCWEDVLNCLELMEPLAKHFGWVTQQWGLRKWPIPTEVSLFAWQAQLLDRLHQTPDDRKILIYVDKEGHHGKTWFTRWLCMHAGATILGNVDQHAAYAYNGEKTVIFDITKDRISQVNWGLVEQVKNGMMFNAKWHSGKKIFDIPHVVVFINDLPDLSERLSKDRYATSVYELPEGREALDYVSILYDYDIAKRWWFRRDPAKLTRSNAILLEDDDDDEPVAGPSTQIIVLETEDEFDEIPDEDFDDL